MTSVSRIRARRWRRHIARLVATVTHDPIGTVAKVKIILVAIAEEAVQLLSGDIVVVNVVGHVHVFLRSLIAVMATEPSYFMKRWIDDFEVGIDIHCHVTVTFFAAMFLLL